MSGIHTVPTSLGEDKLYEAYSSDESLQGLLKFNAITKEQFAKDNVSIVEIECFMQHGVHMSSLQFFCNLKIITIIRQPKVTSIQGLDACYNLEKLYILECPLKSIGGLDNCNHIKELYLYENEIKKIENINHLHKLEVLWLNGNKISKIEGISNLTKIKSLNLAANRIETLENAFLNQTCLEVLNIAGNPLKSFHEILFLNQVKTIKTLYFNDPVYGYCPLSALSNYQTYCLYHLPFIQQLDCTTISEEYVQIAATTYRKKAMFYNMRIKTIKRNRDLVLQKLSTLKQNKLHQISMVLNLLIKQKLDIDKILRLSRGSMDITEETQQSYNAKYDQLEQAISLKTEEISTINSISTNAVNIINDISKDMISIVHTELNNGGNIRVEEGTVNDQWYSNMCEIIKDKFDTEIFKNYGINDVNIKRIWKIENKCVKNAFEDKISEIIEANPNEKLNTSPDYFFYGELPVVYMNEGENHQICDIIQNGFPNTREFLNKTEIEGIILSPTLSTIDLPRIASYMDKFANINGNVKAKPVDSNYKPWNDNLVLAPARQLAILNYKKGKYELPSSYLLICKVVLGKVNDVASITTPLKQTSFTCHTLKYENNESKNQLFISFENELVCPEYLVELQYLNENSSNEQIQQVHQQDFEDIPNTPELSPFLSVLSQYSSSLNNISNISTDTLCNESLHMIPTLSTTNPIHRLTVDLITEITNQNLSDITYLNLHGNCIKAIECLESCSNLVTLILSFNQLSEIDGLYNLRKLETLILSFNMIKRVEGLENNSKLKKLELSNNLIYRESDLKTLSHCCPELEELNFNFNPITEVKDYRYLCLNNLKNLKILDSVDITEEEKQTASLYPLYPTISIIQQGSHLSYIQKESSHLSIQQIPPLNSVNLLYDNKIEKMKMMMNKSKNNNNKNNNNSKKRNSKLSTSSNNISDSNDSDNDMINNYYDNNNDDLTFEISELFSKTVALDLDDKHLHTLSNLTHLENLKQLILSNNVINSLDGLISNTELTELIMYENALSNMNYINYLTNLEVLDLSGNKIANISGLEHLKKLTQLSLESNDISSMKGLNNLSSLLELYIANNKLTNIKDVQMYLKPLPRLLILDLSGNPLTTTTQNYRLFTIYQLRKLKVLDGVSIDSMESNSAKEQYSGKLTKDFLMERLGNHSFDKITELDISGCRIKDIECLSGTDFPSIQSLILDNNYLTNINGLKSIPSLIQLKLNNNRIEEFVPDTIGKSGICSCKNLERLELSHNLISVLSYLHLQYVPRLIYLDLSRNDIMRIDGLDQLTQLQVLNLQGNKLKTFDAEPLRYLRSLKYLNLEENCLRTLTPFPPLYALVYLSLAHNTLRDLSEFDNLCALENLQTINLLGNPVTKKHSYRPPLIRKLPNLSEIDGKEVSQEERDRVEAQYAPRQPPTVIIQEAIQLSRGGQMTNRMNDPRLVTNRPLLLNQYVDPVVRTSMPRPQPSEGMVGNRNYSDIRVSSGSRYRNYSPNPPAIYGSSNMILRNRVGSRQGQSSSLTQQQISQGYSGGINMQQFNDPRILIPRRPKY